MLLMITFFVSSNVLFGQLPGDKEEIIVPETEEDEGVTQNSPPMAVFNLDFTNLDATNGGTTGEFVAGMPDAQITVYDIPAGTFTGSLPAPQYIVYQTPSFNEYDYNLDIVCNGRTSPMYTLQVDLTDELEAIYCTNGATTLTDIVIAMTYNNTVGTSTTIEKYPYLSFPNQARTCGYNYFGFAEVDHTTFYYPTMTLACGTGNGSGSGNGNGNRSRSMDQNEKSVKVFPNPVNEILRFQTSEEIKNVSVFDNTGKVVLIKSNDISKGLDLSELRAGMYMLKIETEEEELFERIVKQ